MTLDEQEMLIDLVEAKGFDVFYGYTDFKKHNTVTDEKFHRLLQQYHNGMIELAEYVGVADHL